MRPCNVAACPIYFFLIVCKGSGLRLASCHCSCPSEEDGSQSANICSYFLPCCIFFLWEETVSGYRRAMGNFAIQGFVRHRGYVLFQKKIPNSVWSFHYFFYVWGRRGARLQVLSLFDRCIENSCFDSEGNLNLPFVDWDVEGWGMEYLKLNNSF